MDCYICYGSFLIIFSESSRLFVYSSHLGTPYLIVHDDLSHLAMKDGSIFLVMLSPNITNSNFLLQDCFLCNKFAGVSSSCFIFPFFPTVSHGFPLSWNYSKVFKISLIFWSTTLSAFTCFFIFSSCSFISLANVSFSSFIFSVIFICSFSILLLKSFCVLDYWVIISLL